MVRRIQQGLVLPVLFLSLTAGILHATAPKAPKNLTGTKATAVVNGRLKSVIRLTWEPGTGPNEIRDYQGFRIYAGQVLQNNVQFGLLGTADSVTFSFTVNTLSAAGTYAFHVDAYNGSGQTAGNVIYVAYDPNDTTDTGGGNAVRFTNSMPHTAYLNTEYLYDADAVSSNGGAVAFALTGGPQGMTMDSLTGVIRWTPTVSGLYTLNIRAFLIADPSVFVSQTGQISVLTNGGGNNGDTVFRFVREITKTAVLYFPYQYTVQAVYRPADQFIYRLAGGPQGMTLDSISGVVAWSPSATGQYQVAFRASLLGDPNTFITQTGVITVTASISHSFAGMVHDSARNGLPAMVIAYRLSANNTDSIRRVAQTHTDSAGNFTIGNIVAGSYILQVRPDDTAYLAAGYFRENDYLTTSWQHATILGVTPSSPDRTVDILVQAAHTHGGLNRLTGSVNGTGGIAKQGPVSQGMTPLADALVSVLDESGTVRGYTFCDGSGRFEVGGLAQGIYHVVADMVGYQTGTSIVTIVDAQPLTTISVTLTQGTSGVTGGTVSPDGDISAVPNVTSRITRLSFRATGTATQISVTDSRGREVMLTTLPTAIGMNVRTLDVSTLPAGTYFLHPGTGAGSGGVRLVVVK